MWSLTDVISLDEKMLLYDRRSRGRYAHLGELQRIKSSFSPEQKTFALSLWRRGCTDESSVRTSGSAPSAASATRSAARRWALRTRTGSAPAYAVPRVRPASVSRLRGT
ncbi:hypothetical protein WOLCODRAFT_26350 [Wolfiporia cocos MD-104 SS10]|uniref:Uncharacterized protein n=1 Tax=Wolfiporia cocos (strain MD-104) TaxID=742152 RepID=A0A2H3K698_WOLCO|nr:hypothetical protein WOLCODRAFT_26350 [Wolfiporia cocos MD-104 SS10]